MQDEPLDAEKQALIDRVKLHCEQLGEHVDTVQIFVSVQVPGGHSTRTYDYGSGNFYARLGQVTEWLTAQDEYTREWARTKQRGES